MISLKSFFSLGLNQFSLLLSCFEDPTKEFYIIKLFGNYLVQMLSKEHIVPRFSRNSDALYNLSSVITKTSTRSLLLKKFIFQKVKKYVLARTNGQIEKIYPI